MVLGISIFSDNGAMVSHSGLSVGLMDEELAELETTGTVRRTFGTSVMSATLKAGTIVQVLLEGRE